MAKRILTCGTCKADLTKTNAILVISRTAMTLVKGGLILPIQPAELTASDIGDEDIECARCGELVYRTIPLRTEPR